jgi:hypothetical protein
VIPDAAGPFDTRSTSKTLDALDVGGVVGPQRFDTGTLGDTTPVDAPDAPVAPDAAKPLDALDANEAGSMLEPREAGSTPDSREVGGETKGCSFIDGGQYPSPYPFRCGRGYIGSICDDVLYPPQCIAGEWSCGTDNAGRPWPREDQCTCVGQIPSGYARCECIGHSWKCYEGDGGSSDVRFDVPRF